MSSRVDLSKDLPAFREEWYKEAYEGVESAQNFSSTEELARFRELLLEKSRPQVEFILKYADAPVRLIEIGTGNGRIPISLHGVSALDYALGIDISSSRIGFAKKWAENEGIGNVDFEEMDVLEFPDLPRDFHLALCITGTFGYFAPGRQGMDRSFLEYLSNRLVEGGTLILELYSLPAFVSRCLESPDRTYRFWQHLPPEDPFSLYLQEMTYSEESSVLSVHKIFIRRQDGWIDDGRREYLRIYRQDEMVGLLESCGFEVRSIEDGFSEDEGLDDVLGKKIYVARKYGGGNMSLVKNVGALSLANILVQSIYFAYSFVFRMILGPQLTGIWNLARLVLGYLSNASTGIEIGSERKIPILHGEGNKEEAVKVRSTLFSYVLIEALVVALILWGYMLVWGGGYQEQEFWAIMAVGVYAVLTRLMSCFIISYRTIHQFVNLSKVMVVQALLDVVIILPALFLFSFYGLLVAFGISLFLKLVWFDYIRRKNGIFQMKWHLDLTRLKGLLSLGFPIMIGNYFWKIFVTLDSILVVWFMGTTYLAYYTVGAAIMIQLSEIPTNVSAVLTPRLFERFGKSSDTSSLLPDLKRFFTGNLFCIAPILCCVGFFGIPFLVRHLIPEFSDGIIVVQILIFALFMIPQTHIPNQLLILLKKRVEYSILILAGISAVASLVLVFHTVNASIAAVALGAVSGYMIYFLLLVYRVLSQLYGVEEVWWVYRRFAVGLVGSATVFWGISALIPGSSETVGGDLLMSLGKGGLALILLSPLVWYGSTDIGLNDFLVRHLWCRGSSADTAGDHATS